MKNRGKLTGFFSGFAPISPKPAEKQHEKALSASRKPLGKFRTTRITALLP
jgi:hypothetical protein